MGGDATDICVRDARGVTCMPQSKSFHTQKETGYPAEGLNPDDDRAARSGADRHRARARSVTEIKAVVSCVWQHHANGSLSEVAKWQIPVLLPPARLRGESLASGRLCWPQSWSSLRRTGSLPTKPASRRQSRRRILPLRPELSANLSASQDPRHSPARPSVPKCRQLSRPSPRMHRLQSGLKCPRTDSLCRAPTAGPAKFSAAMSPCARLARGGCRFRLSNGRVRPC